MVKSNMKRDIKGCKYCNSKDLPKWYINQKLDEINPFAFIVGDYNKLTDHTEVYCEKHDYYYDSTIQNLLNGHGCYYCGIEKLSNSSFNTIEKVQENINRINPHIKVLEYYGAKEPIKCHCNIHNKDFTKTYYILTNSKSGCDECYTENIRERQVMGIDEFKNRLKLKFPQVEVLGEYINNSTPIELYCNEHNCYYSLTPASILNRHACCIKSRVTYKEETICSILEKWGFRIGRQKTFSDCIDKRELPFDIYLIDYNILLEYQGEQHYKKVRFGESSDEEVEWRFEYTKKHDNIKRQYCIDNNIPLIEIPYWEYNNIENYLFDELVKYNAIKKIS